MKRPSLILLTYIFHPILSSSWGGSANSLFQMGTQTQTPTPVSNQEKISKLMVATYHHEKLYGAGILYKANILLTMTEKHREDAPSFLVVKLDPMLPVVEHFEEDETLHQKAIRVLELLPYTDTSRTFTLTVFKLDQPAAGSGANFEIAERSGSGSIGRLVGWSYPFRHRPVHLTRVDAVVLSPRTCDQRALFWVNHTSETCLGDLENNRLLYPYVQGSALLLPPYSNYEDEGGKLRVLGLYSWNEENVHNTHPAVFLRLYTHLNWLNSVI